MKGSGRQYIGAVTSFVAYYIIGIPVGIVLGFKTDLGVIGLWAGMTIGNAVQVNTCIHCFHRSSLIAKIKGFFKFFFLGGGGGGGGGGGLKLTMEAEKDNFRAGDPQ